MASLIAVVEAILLTVGSVTGQAKPPGVVVSQETYVTPAMGLTPAEARAARAIAKEAYSRHRFVVAGV